MIFSRDHVKKGDLEYQKGNFLRAAELYLKAKRFRQAAEVFIKAGEVQKAVEIYVDSGSPRKAAEVLAAERRYKEAIPHYEEAGAFAQAAEACLKVQQSVRAGRLFEQAGRYRRAAETFTKAGEIEHALRAWETASEVLRGKRSTTKDHALEKEIRELDAHRAEILSNVGRHLEAAKLMAEHGHTTRAAPLFERAGQFAAAAEAYLGAGRVTEALASIEKAPDAADELRAEIYLNCGRHEEAGEIFEQMGRFDAAASAFEGAEAWAQAAVLWEKAESYARAAEFFRVIERYQDAGRCFAKADRHEDAATAFADAGNDQSAADAYMAAGNLLMAGEHYVKAGYSTAAKEALQTVSPSSPDYAQASLDLIPLMVEEHMIEAARQRLAMLRESNTDIASHTLDYCQGRIEEARGRYDRAEVCYQRVLARRHDFRDVNERLRNVRGKVGGTSGSFLQADPKWQARDTVRTLRTRPSGSTPSQAFESTATAEVGTLTVASERQRAPESTGANREKSEATSPSAELPVFDATDLPFKIEDRVDPWWSGAEFFRATDRRNKKAILLVSFPLAEVGSRFDAFSNGMRQVQALRHPTILKLDELIRASDKVLLVYEPFGGETLGHHLANEQLPAVTSLNLIVQLADTLSNAHKLGVTHQWISPRTILLDADGRIKLVGIGLRDVLADRDTTSQAYMSPEVRDDGVIGPASDVYGLGLLAVTLLRAGMPATSGDPSATIDPDAVTWPDDVIEAIPASARRLLLRALANEPLQRPSTAELASALSSTGLVPGQILADRYEILGELGRGGMSRVYRARDRAFPDEEVAIKTLLTPAIGRSEDEDRLMREVQICRKISHPNVVRVHDYGRFPGGIFVTMELLDGPGLDMIIEHETQLEVARVREILKGIAAALSEAHRLKIIHRDLKPSNVIVIDDRVKVLDFGIARMGDSAASNLTRTGEVIGSPMFMAPEQIQGQPLTGTCDLYALGVIAFTLLTGREPFLADTTTAIVLKHLHEPPPDVRELRPGLAQEWVDLLAKLLAKKPTERYQSAEELIGVLYQLPE